MRVLIAEDDIALASFVRKGLEAEHYAVDVSHDGEQTRAMAGELDYDLLMLDLNLPRVDGVAILRHLRNRKPSMPILVLTGRNRVEDRVLCLDLGADDYLGKPFSYAELSARIRALLRRSHLPAASVLSVEDLKLDRVERRVEERHERLEEGRCSRGPARERHRVLRGPLVESRRRAGRNEARERGERRRGRYGGPTQRRARAAGVPKERPRSAPASSRSAHRRPRAAAAPPPRRPRSETAGARPSGARGSGRCTASEPS